MPAEHGGRWGGRLSFLLKLSPVPPLCAGRFCGEADSPGGDASLPADARLSLVSVVWGEGGDEFYALVLRNVALEFLRRSLR